MGDSDLILQVEILDGEEVAETLELDGDKIKVGKLATSQLHLDDPKVSRIHAVLENQGDGTYQAIDLGSASGTYLNGEKITKEIVGDGDELRFGETTVRINIVDPAEQQQQQAAAAAGGAQVYADGEIPEGHIQLEDGTVVQPYTLQGYYDDAGNYIPGYYDEEGAYHYGYGYHDDEGTWQVAHGYYDPNGEWVPTDAPEGQGPSNTELYTANFFNDEPRGTTLQLAHLWNDQVLDVQSLKQPTTIVIGGHEENDYVIDDASLTQERFPFVVFEEQGGYRVNFTPQMEGMVQKNGEQMPLADAINGGLASQSMDAQGAYSLQMSRDMSVRLDFGGNTFLLNFARLPALAGGAFAVERAPLVYQGVSLALHVAFMILVFTLPDGFGQLELHDHDMEDRFAELAQPPEEEEEEELEDLLDDEDTDEEEEAEAEAPDEDEVEDIDEPEIEGEDDMDEEELQEERDHAIATDHGALAAFEGDPQDAIGDAAETALADLDADVSADGALGLGMEGAGRGGAEGEDGVGRAAVGTGGSGMTPGDGVDGDLGDADIGDPQVVPQEPETQGALDREIIQRVVRQNRRQIRHCYEQQLQRNPDLSGTVTMEWVISPTGDVVNASVSESTLNSSEVEQCMSQRIRQWSFPEPDGGGVVRVNYPFNFSN